VAGKAGKGKKREEFVDQIKTRPETAEGILDKRGGGRTNVIDQVVRLKANFFRVETKQKFSVSLYRVDFNPETEIIGLKRNLIQQHRDRLGNFLFDGGAQVYLMRDLGVNEILLQSVSREDVRYEVRLRKTRVVLYTEGMFLQVMNLVVRQAMQHLNLKLVGRDFFDDAAAVS
jgi:aubergine